MYEAAPRIEEERHRRLVQDRRELRHAHDELQGDGFAFPRQLRGRDDHPRGGPIQQPVKLVQDVRPEESVRSRPT